jgi:hypothetical protein
MQDGTPFGRYRLLELTSRGAMGDMWRAFDTVTQRESTSCATCLLGGKFVPEPHGNEIYEGFSNAPEFGFAASLPWGFGMEYAPVPPSQVLCRTAANSAISRTHRMHRVLRLRRCWGRPPGRPATHHPIVSR